MSETVNYKGYLQEVPLLNNSLEETVRKILKDIGRVIPEAYEDDYLCYFTDELYDRFYISSDKTLYEVFVASNNLEYEDIFEVEQDSEVSGRRNFHLKYYNGGCGQEEAFDEAFEKLQERLKDG